MKVPVKNNESRHEAASSAFEIQHACVNECAFRYTIVKFSKKQRDELKQTCELRTIRNIRLSNTLPRKLLHVRNSALGVGLIEPKIKIDYLAIKLHIRNESELISLINIYKEMRSIDSGLPKIAR